MQTHFPLLWGLINPLSEACQICCQWTHTTGPSSGCLIATFSWNCVPHSILCFYMGSAYLHNAHHTSSHKSCRKAQMEPLSLFLVKASHSFTPSAINWQHFTFEITAFFFSLIVFSIGVSDKYGRKCCFKPYRVDVLATWSKYQNAFFPWILLQYSKPW